MSLLTLRRIAINFGGELLLDQANLQIKQGEHLCLIGRNGVGKSTLLKLITKQLEPDSGDIECKPGFQASYLAQEIPQNLQGTVYDVVADGLGTLGAQLAAYEQLSQQLHTHHDDTTLLKRFEQLQQQIEFNDGWACKQRIEAVISQMNLCAESKVASLSGGMLRRVLLAKALVTDPDILVLDEPTNHLDIDAINWLETFLVNYKKTVLFVSHDRDFMQAIASRFVEIDNQQIYSYPGNYQAYLKQKESALNALQTEQNLFDKRLAEEEKWIRQGIKARRTRNEGRVRALKEMRKLRAQRILRPGTAEISIKANIDSGKIVFEADKLNYSYADKLIVKNFSCIITRGDKVGIIGPNGSGKTTLIKLLLKKLIPTGGEIKHGTNLAIAYFDQYRHQLNEEKSVQENVCDGDMITVGDKSIHVMSYLQKFLFSPQRARNKVKVLSGGERNRLLLAKLFAKPSNVLVMDEPTNDLDIETLELLEEQLAEYPGTLLLVSHDRAFLNNVVTSTIVLEGNGHVAEYVGGYDDWLRQRKNEKSEPQKEKIKKNKTTTEKLSYNDQRELDQLPEKISALEADITEIQHKMADPQFYQQDGAAITAAQQQLATAIETLKQLYLRWEDLEKK